MKIVAISDTHCKHKKVTIPDGDILICAGDFTSIGQIHEVADFNNWLGNLPHPIKLVCAGNHDGLFEKDYSLGKSLLTNAVYLQHELYENQNLKFWFSPYTPKFCNWFFMRNRGSDILEMWKQIPENIDVLVTHGPPYSILDTVYPKDGYENLGCLDLYNEIIHRIKPKIHIYGHIHGGQGNATINNIRFYNVSVCDEAYCPVNKPTVIEIN